MHDDLLHPPVVLVVDDDPECILTLGEGISDAAQVIVARDGKEALALLESGEHIPEIILLDVFMPGVDGYETCTRIRNNPAFNDIPILFVTSHEEQNPLKGIEGGALDFIRKPVDIPVLKQKIINQVALQRRKSSLLSLVRSELKLQFTLNDVLARIAKDLLSKKSAEDLSEIVLEAAKGLTQSKFGFAGILDPCTGDLECHTMNREVWELCQVYDKSFKLKYYTGLWGWVLKNKAPLLTNTPQVDPRSTGTPHGHVRIDSFLAVPVMAGDELLGQISVSNSSRPYSKADQEALDKLADLFGIAILRYRDDKRLIQAKEIAETASKAKSAFLANMSHEIRTPLNGVLGMLQLMETTALDTKQMGYVAAAIRSSKRLTALLADILDLSRIESGKLSLCEEEFDLSNLKESVLELFSLATKHEDVILDFHIDESVPTKLLGDEVRLRQILFNLVGNAIKFTTEGHIKIEVSLTRVECNGDCRALFSVEDTGIGIPDERLNDIFEPFVQGEDTYCRTYQGAGLGLSIVSRLVTFMGGSLTLDNTEGGTTIYFSLPLKIPQNTADISYGAAKPLPVALSCSRRILLAEDEAINALAIKRLLDMSGYAVTIAGDGQQVINLLEEQDFDLILMDIQMPIMGGVEATKRIRASGTSYANIPIVAMTAYAMDGDREKFLDCSMNDYISKPLEIMELKVLIQRVLGNRDS